MNKPKFEVGEVVILQSVLHSEYNGEYTVESVIGRGDSFKDRLTGDVRTSTDNQYGYQLSQVHTYNGKEIVWKETLLRKKHQPGEMSFTNLMSSLKQPQGAQA